MKKTKIITGLCLLMGTAGFGQEPFQLPPRDSIESMLKTMQVPGVAIATLIDGKVDEVMAFGLRQPEVALSSDALFNTASLTKSVTAYLAIQLVEAGLLKLDEQLSAYWIDPDLKDDDRVELLTPHIILSHRTGFDNWRRMNEEQKLRFNFDPGTNLSYSGEGFEYLRRALEAKFKTSFRELAETYVFSPLQMHDTYLSWSDEISEVRFAGEYKTLAEPYEITKGKPNAADDLITTAADLGRFCERLLEVSRQDAYQLYFEPKSDVRPGIKFTYGWIRFDDLPSDEYALFSAGSDAGVSAIMCLLPNSNRGIVLLSNGENRGLVVNLMRVSLAEIGNEIVVRF